MNQEIDIQDLDLVLCNKNDLCFMSIQYCFYRFYSFTFLQEMQQMSRTENNKFTRNPFNFELILKIKMFIVKEKKLLDIDILKRSQNLVLGMCVCRNVQLIGLYWHK